ncbi:hypothetical protein GGF43_000664 [Coemansia sp. RSA 2618]|nr:hypothetical protein GGF43_000664 [Coemansia sp. RSA 2618]
MLMYDCSDTNIDETDAATTVCSQMRSELSSLLPFLVAYTCAAPLRAKGSTSSSQKCIDADIIRWWLPQSGELLDARALPSPAQLSSHRLQSPQAQHVCTKDWIAPVVDHFDDERALGSDTASVVHDLLMRARRSDVDLVVRRRLLPIIYDYVVKDVTVGVDNWRVITRPGTSLLNRRQTAVVISVLVEARYFAQLLDLLLWLLSHTRVSNIVVLVHATLRRFTWAWALLGKLPAAIAQVEQAYGAAAGADSFEFEYLRTAQHWYTTDPDLARDLHQRVSADYEAFADSHAPALVAQGGSHVPSQSGTGKELLQLAQQLVRDRAREAISSATDEIDWAILPCFQKLARIAFAATQRGDLGSSPGTLHFDFPSLPHGTGAHRPRLQAMLAHIVADTVRAAVSTGSTLKLNAAERASDEMLLRTFVDLCVMFIRWFSLNAGLLSAPENIGPAALSALSAAAGEWALSTTGSNGGSTSSLEGVAAVHNSAAAAEIEVAMFIGHALMGSMLSTGCIRVHELVPWLINRCRDQALPQSAAQHACVAGIIHALGEPASVDRALLGDDAGSCDSRRLYEALEIGACWATAFETHKLSRIQAVELVFTSAAASGKLRDIGQLHIAASLMHATSALARSWWIQAIIDCVPNADDSGYYTILEIYRANIEPQISDPRVSLPVKRAVLRALMTLCEGTDPTADGFSAMTTAEVAHRLHSTLRRFWTGTAFSSVHKLSAILNSLLLFAGSALRESEASTDAFAMAAGGARMIIGSAVRSAGHSRTASGQDGGGSLEQVQFVSDATTYVVACVLNAVLTWSAGSVGADDRLRARLAEALGTLAPDVVLQLVEACAHSLFALNVEQLHGLSVPGSDGSVTAGTAEKDATGKAMPVDQRMAALISASSGNVSDMVNSFIDNSGSGVSGNDYDDRNDVAIGSDDANVACKRGFALAQFIQQLVATLGKIPEDERKRGFSAGSTLAMVRDFAGGVLGQLQAIALHANASIAQMLALCITQQPLPEQQDVSLSPARLQMAVFWRFQAVRPLCHLMRAYPDEFGAGEWLTTLVTLSLAPACQPSGPQADNGLFQLLADFAAIVSESITAPMRKQALSLMRSVAPQLRSLVRDPKRADILSRLFPFEVSTVLTRGIAPRECEGLDNPWMWIEALEFTPLASLSSTAAMGGGLEGMTPFTLRGMLEQDNKARGAAAGVSTGYLANLRLCESNVSRDQQVAESRGLQYLENPYFPMQPAMLFPLAETPIPWQVFAAKRRRMDAETRLVWRSQCEAAFGSIP